jgi:predicted ester cyclase
MSGQADQSMVTASAAEVHRRIVELWGAGRLAEALTLIAHDAIDHRGGTSGDHIGPTAWQDKWEHMHDGLRDISLTIEQNVASGDFSVNRYTFRGTHAASGRHVELIGIDMVRVRDGKLAEHWALLDSAALRHQLSPDAR